MVKRWSTGTSWAPLGPQVLRGLQGATGPQDPTGTTGPQGETGAPGTNGIKPDPACFDNTSCYVNCGNGTVTDTRTGLGLTDDSSPGDWRLPTEDE
jgi:hypothetical protein